MSGHVFDDREDNLAYCKVCRCGEGELAKDCPGTPVDESTRDAIMAGSLDFSKEKGWFKP